MVILSALVSTAHTQLPQQEIQRADVGGQQQAALDIFLFVVGLVITVLGLLRYVETPYYNLISSVANMVMWILICKDNIADLNYLIMAAYSLFRVAQSVVTWTKQYQKSKKESEPEAAVLDAE